MGLYEKYCLEECPEREIYKPYYEGRTGICPSCQLDSFISYIEETTDFQRVLKAAQYWLSSNRPGGQAETKLKCGHIGRLGAPMCKTCTQEALATLLEKANEY